MKAKKYLFSLLVVVSLISSTVVAFANENTSKNTIEKEPSVFAAENIQSALSQEGIIDFALTPEYMEAEKSANERQESYGLKRSSKPVQPDKGNNTRAMGTYPTRKGVILISNTPSGSSGSFIGHAGIVYSQSWAEESFAKSFSPKGIDGVWYYANDWNTRYSNNKVYGITVSGTTAAQDAAVADWAEMQEGKPYNWNFLNWGTRSSFYCSQLVYAGYLDNTGVNIWGFYDFVLPMDLYYNSNTYSIYEN